MRAFLPLAGLALVLSACTASEAPEPAETMMPVEPDGGIGDGATPLPELLEDSDAPETTGPDEAALEEDAEADARARGITGSGATPTTIPADYHGVWDYVDGSCNPASDLRLEISGNRIVFYESVGQVTGIERRTNGDLIVSLAMSGEGETWDAKWRLAMDSTAMRLVAQNVETEGESPYSRRKRCPST